jgi:hypothetical protein
VGGAGVLVFVEILRIHFRNDVLDENGIPDPHKMDLIARMGDDWYCRASGPALFRLPKPTPGGAAIGFDGLPEQIRTSPFLSGNEIAQMAALPELPETSGFDSDFFDNLLPDFLPISDQAVYERARNYINRDGKPEWALAMLLAYHSR